MMPLIWIKDTFPTDEQKESAMLRIRPPHHEPPSWCGGVAVTAWLLLAAPCMALECPTPQPAGAPGAIQETPAQISDLSQVLASGDLGNRIPVFVHTLRSGHPHAPTGELVNHLVTAYCPVVNSLTGLRDGEKQARLDAFITRVTVAAY
jgi:hypothetical protein